MADGMKSKAARPEPQAASKPKVNTSPVPGDYLKPRPPGAWEDLMAQARQAIARRPGR